MVIDKSFSDGVDSNGASDGSGSNGVMMAKQNLGSDCSTGVSVPFMVLYC